MVVGECCGYSVGCVALGGGGGGGGAMTEYATYRVGGLADTGECVRVLKMMVHWIARSTL